jgi:hypothetical protein
VECRLPGAAEPAEAGIASLVKTALAMAAGTIPPGTGSTLAGQFVPRMREGEAKGLRTTVRSA